jgi:putative DNA primase/helicase
VGNSRLVFAVACAFAGPLLRPAGMESGGFHIRRDSSSGKTTALRLAASVNGGPSYMQRWRTTDNALEAIAAQHCDSLLILDELAQVEGKVAGECAYMLANEQSKARATRNGAPRARLSWRLLFLSAGELGLADHMAEGMKRTRTGQEVRMADIPADAGRGLGTFEHLHDLRAGLRSPVILPARRRCATAHRGERLLNGRASMPTACPSACALLCRSCPANGYRRAHRAKWSG